MGRSSTAAILLVVAGSAWTLPSIAWAFQCPEGQAPAASVLYTADVLPEEDPAAVWIKQTGVSPVPDPTVSGGVLTLDTSNNGFLEYSRLEHVGGAASAFRIDVLVRHLVFNSPPRIPGVQVPGSDLGVVLQDRYIGLKLDNDGVLGIHDASLGQPIATIDPLQWHRLTVEAVRDGPVFFLLDGALVATRTWDELPVAGGGLVSAGTAIAAFSSTGTLTEWDSVSYDICPPLALPPPGTPIEIAKLAVLDAAQVITAVLPARRADQVTHKLVGSGGALSKLERAELFLGAGRSCAAVGSISAAAGKVDAATSQVQGSSCAPAGQGQARPGLRGRDPRRAVRGGRSGGGRRDHLLRR